MLVINICVTTSTPTIVTTRDMSHQVGSRVYVTSIKSYATVTKTRFLGKPGVLVSSDTGDALALNEERANAEIYSKESGKNGNGDSIELPLDVREEGIGILTSMGVPEEGMRLLFLKYVVGLDQATQEGRINEFNEVKDDETKRQEFLTRLLAELESDQGLVLKEGSAALFYVNSETRSDMFQRLLVDYPREQREALVMTWMGVKNERKAKEAFLHEMYLKLMTEDQYIQVEGVKALAGIGLGPGEQEAILDRIFQTQDAEKKNSFIQEWKKVRSSNSRKKFFLKNLMKKLGY